MNDLPRVAARKRGGRESNLQSQVQRAAATVRQRATRFSKRNTHEARMMSSSEPNRVTNCVTATQQPRIDACIYSSDCPLQHQQLSDCCRRDLHRRMLYDCPS